jgi:DNA-binding GntR family transcriptional regulator
VDQSSQKASPPPPKLTFPRIGTTSLSQVAYNILREKIISRELAPGQRLDLELIKNQLGISRTPLKDALKQLEIEGLITILPRSGTFVTDPDPAEIADSFDLRRILEIYAVELVVQRASDQTLQELGTLVQELGRLLDGADPVQIYADYLSLDHCFHQKLVSLADNPRLSQAHDRENMHSQMARIRYRSAIRDLQTPQAEHERLLGALQAREIERAKQTIATHLERAKSALLADMGVPNATE